jgi:hypothetical protein
LIFYWFTLEISFQFTIASAYPVWASLFLFMFYEDTI